MAFPLQYPVQYDSAEWSSGVVTKYDVTAQTLFVNCKTPTHVVVRVDVATTIYFGTSSHLTGDILATNAAPITVAANTAFEIDLVFTSMLITTSAPTNVKIFMSQANPS